MITTKGKPISGSGAKMAPRSQVRTETSRNTEKQIKMPQQPFANARGAAKAPAPTNRNFAKAQTAGRPAANLHGGSSRAAHNITNHSIHNGTTLSADQMAALGYKPNATKGINPIHSGFPTRGKK
jgi:hypothetical protein